MKVNTRLHELLTEHVDSEISGSASRMKEILQLWETFTRDSSHLNLFSSSVTYSSNV